MPGYRSLRDLDWPMLILAFAICSLGVLQIFSATHDTTWFARRLVEAGGTLGAGGIPRHVVCDIDRLPYAAGADPDFV